MKKIISIILSLTLVFSLTITTSANTTFLTGEIFVKNVQNISFNNDWECSQITRFPSDASKLSVPESSKNLTHIIGVTTGKYSNIENVSILIHKNTTSIEEGKNILTKAFASKNIQFKNYNGYKEYSIGESEYVYSFINLTVGVGEGVKTKYYSVLYFIKCFPLEKKTYIGARAIETDKKITTIPDSYITQFRNKINILNTNKIVQKINPLSSKSIKHFTHIKKLLKKKRFKTISATKESTFLSKYYESFSVRAKKKSKYKNISILDCDVYPSMKRANYYYKSFYNSIKGFKKNNTSVKTKNIKIKTKNYKGIIQVIYYKKTKLAYVYSSGLNKKTNVLTYFIASKKIKSFKKALKFRNKYRKFTKKILRG